MAKLEKDLKKALIIEAVTRYKAGETTTEISRTFNLARKNIREVGSLRVDNKNHHVANFSNRSAIKLGKLLYGDIRGPRFKRKEELFKWPLV